ncbi:TfuA-like protein [Polymorphospora rubra]|uniref:TfuA-like core domain-containing protein n=1 Tax=Polymorphospora rubra TaxID=338584 RepID=A0A810MX14_9ACTN|nr:TfuA-like protein [Polymorphospora rubra]BCJ65707.1 hypothetical protein Prubr_27280 [Polymorphospora rubra]
MTLVVFAGPSAGRLWTDWAARDDVDMRLPAVRGDVASLVNSDQPGTLVLADGAFDRSYAVGHRELLEAASLGWRIIGVSSLGAIRATDLPGTGVRGVGQAYGYLVNTKAPDDHLALIYEPEPPFRIFAEALFDVRQCLRDRALPAETGAIDAFLEDAARWWFGDRTRDQLQDRLETYVSADRAAQLLAPLASPLYNRAKQLDLIDLMKELLAR